MSETRNTVMTWLSLPSEFDFTKARPLGRLVGWGALGIYVVLVLTLAGGLIAVLAATIGHFFDGAATWDGHRWSLLTIATLTATLGAAIALPMTILRTRYTLRQTVAAEQNLITDRINQAVAGLGAEKTVKLIEETPRYKKDPEIDDWLKDEDGNLVPATRPDGQPLIDRAVFERSEPNIEVRVGAILSLERISENSAKDAKDAKDHVRIMEILCAYVRENACLVPVKEKPEGPEDWKQRTDTQMALTVIGRRTADRLALETTAAYTLDLRGADVQLADMSRGAWQNARLSDAVMARALLVDANLQGAELRDANLQGANLAGANLQEADLGGADLQEASLNGANLQEAYLEDANLQEAKLWDADLLEADLRGANLQEANLGGANLQEAKLWGAKLQEAFLNHANLQKANLAGANLREAKLMDTNLREANLGGANLQEANLWGATLKSADLRNWTIAGTFLGSADFSESQNLSQEAVNSAFGVKSGIGRTILPEGLTAPAHWHVAGDVEEDSNADFGAAREAYQEWLVTLPPAAD